MCVHPAPGQGSGDGDGRPHIVAGHPEQGWSLLCDGTIQFDDTGELRPDGRVVPPCRTAATTHTGTA